LVTPLLSKDLRGIPGKEGLMIIVDYAPGATDAIHRHNAHVFVYVLEGSVVMQVRGGKEVRRFICDTGRSLSYLGDL
jgi:quercetin dioxygenase-like cupin family protein